MRRVTLGVGISALSLVLFGIVFQAVAAVRYCANETGMDEEKRAGADVKAAADNLLSAVKGAIDEVASRMAQSRVDEDPAH